LLCAMGLASIWAFVGPKYPNAPDNVPLAYQVPRFRDQGSVLRLDGYPIVLARDSDVRPGAVS
jgi:hypothetical protein